MRDGVGGIEEYEQRGISLVLHESALTASTNKCEKGKEIAEEESGGNDAVLREL